MSYKLPDLPYDFSALEPVISAEIMELHYKKHHLAYVNNLNVASEKYVAAEEKGDVAEMIALQPALRFNGGGHVNHSIFWSLLTPVGQGGAPEGALLAAIQKDFGSVQKLMERLTALSVGIQGSGWGWMGWHKEGGRLVLTTCANQDPLSTQGLVPLLGIDVWEHAYYLQYKNVRADYVKNVWEVMNWKEIGKRLEAAVK